MNNTQHRRERFAESLERMARLVRDSESSEDFRQTLDELARMSRDDSGLHAAIMAAEYYECDSCGSDLHAEWERGTTLCRHYAKLS